MSLEFPDIAEAETVVFGEGAMCGHAMRGTDGLQGSKTASRAKRNATESGRSHRRPERRTPLGLHREDEEQSPMVNEHEKSEPALDAVMGRASRA